VSSPIYIAGWIHLVWCTANRRPCFGGAQARAVSRYLSNCAKSKDIAMRIAFVNPEHVHALVGLGASMSVHQMVKLLKGSSSYWISKSEMTAFPFAWHPGYAAITVSPDGVGAATRYIAMQGTYHKRYTVADELDRLAPGWRAGGGPPLEA
jgi:REP-associated tyrosine transposase